MLELPLDTQKTMLLVMDVQNDKHGMLYQAGQEADLLDNILRDCVGAPDPELHAVLMDRVFRMQAGNSNAAEFVESIS